MTPEALEGFVDADEAGKWWFRLNEIAAAVSSKEKPWFSSRQRTGMVRPTAVPGCKTVAD